MHGQQRLILIENILRFTILHNAYILLFDHKNSVKLISFLVYFCILHLANNVKVKAYRAIFSAFLKFILNNRNVRDQHFLT